jgi:hypothetical protein
MPPAAIVAGAVVVGAVAGSMSDESESNSTSGVKLGAASEFEDFLSGTKIPPRPVDNGFGFITGNAHINAAQAEWDRKYAGKVDKMGEIQKQYGKLSDMVDAGPGQQDVTNSIGAGRDFADMLKRYSQQGGSDPTAQDISGANSLASQMFQGQRTAMGQAFSDQREQFARQAALMGRDASDPILAAKLAQEQTRQGSLLDANQGAWASQYALGQPDRRLGYAGQRVDMLSGLASQAMSNRQALLSVGSQLQAGERNWRLSTAQQYSNSKTESGGGLKGALQGGLAGLGAGMGAAGGMGGGGGGGFGGGATGAVSGFNYAQPARQFFGMSAQPSYMPAPPPMAFPSGPSWGGQARNYSLSGY